MGWSRIRRIAGLLPVLLALWTLTACSSGSGARGGAPGGGSAASSAAAFAPLGGGDERPAWEREAVCEPAQPEPRRDATGRVRERPEPARAQAPAPAQATGGPHTRITWEALAVERDRFANPRFGRKPTRGALMTQKIVLVNTSHPEAAANRIGRSMRENKGVAVGAISDEEMDMFVKGLEQKGFFRLTRPTSGIECHFSNDDARGRITVERGGQSVSLLSMRGQGLNPSTKQIPAMYSQVKQAILVLRNRIPTLSVVGARRTPLSR